MARPRVSEDCIECGGEYYAIGLCLSHYNSLQHQKHRDKRLVLQKGYYYERGGAEKQRERRLINAFGLTINDYDALLEAQGGRCAICGSEDPRARGDNFVVDHDHESGGVRGLLCNPCNAGIGALGDDPDTLLAATFYLLKGEPNGL